MHDQRRQKTSDLRNQDKILVRIEREAAKLRPEIHRAGRGEMERVAVGTAVGDIFCADEAAGAGLVDHDNRLPVQAVFHEACDRARIDVGPATRRIADDEIDRFVRKVLGNRRGKARDRDKGSGQNAD